MPNNISYSEMAPVQPDDAPDLNPNPNAMLDWHYTQPTDVDLNQNHDFLRLFHEACALTNFGSTLRIIEKRFGVNDEYLGFTDTSIALPEQFNGMWCRFFYRGDDVHILVMDYDRRDFVIYDLSTNYRLGRWMLPAGTIPDDAVLTAVDTLPWEADFQLSYSLNDNQHTIQRSFNAPQWSHWNPAPAQLAAIH